MSITQILVSLADGDRHPLGSCWSIKTKKNDFYIEPLGSGKRDVLHLSLHGPWPGKPAHRFHIKLDETTAARKRTTGQLIEHGIPTAGNLSTGFRSAPTRSLFAASGGCLFFNVLSTELQRPSAWDFRS